MFDEILKEIQDLLPPIEYVENVLNEHTMERLINRNFYKIVSDDWTATDAEQTQNSFIMVDACRDRLWETINTGHFSKVSKIDRQLYTLATLQKTVLRLIAAYKESTAVETVVEQCIWDLDNGLLLGCPFDHPKYDAILSDCLNVLHRHTNSICDDTGPSFDSEECTRPANDAEKSPVIILHSPSVQEFRENHFDKSMPAILTGSMNHWPALSKWIQPQYLLRVASHRIVPIEVGSNYTKESWTQYMVKFQDFFRRQLVDDVQSSDRIEYLAQHNLFDQIPALKDDILVPDYCCVSNRTDSDTEQDIKAWLGPKGTVSPMHYDSKHNLLCQIFGYKRIILAAPTDSHNLYPFEGNLLGNTSQIDAEHLDFDTFPLVKNVKFYEFTLYRGEMLYIPPKWWHHVRSLSKSFSVSFWWE